MRADFWFILFIIFVTIFTLICGCLSTNQVMHAEQIGVTPAPLTDAGLQIITEEFPPFNYADSKGQAAGQATEVVNGILTRLNQSAQIEILPWSEGYSRALAGPDVVLYSTARTDERENLFKWVGPIASFEYMLYAKNASDLQINSLEAAKKVRKIGVVKDDARYQFLLQNRFENIVTCETDTECLRDLLTGNTDLWLGSTANAATIAEKAGIDPSSFKEVYPVRTVQMYIAFSNDTPDTIVQSWQGTLDAMKRDGTFDTIRRNYGSSASTGTEVPASAGSEADLALSAIIAETDGRLKSVLRTYEVLAGTSEVQSGDWQNIRPLLAIYEQQEPDSRVWYAMPNGSYYTVVDGLTTGNLMSRSYFPVVLAGNESIGTVVVSLSTGKNAAVVAVPVKDKDMVTGVLGASVYLDTLTQTLRDEVPDPYIFYGIDKEGKFAIHSDTGQISRDISTIDIGSSYGQALQQIRSEDLGEVSYEDGGVQYQVRFRTSPLTGWRFVVAWPQVENETSAGWI
jgi:polar amino acid transport system substrate-binding protein